MMGRMDDRTAEVLRKLSKKVDVQTDAQNILSQEDEIVGLACVASGGRDEKGLVRIVRQLLKVLRICLSGKAPEECAIAIVTLIVIVILYLVSPIDAIPDFIPLLGYADDVAVLMAAYRALETQIKEILAKAKE